MARFYSLLLLMFLSGCADNRPEMDKKLDWETRRYNPRTGVQNPDMSPKMGKQGPGIHPPKLL